MTSKVQLMQLLEPLTGLDCGLVSLNYGGSVMVHLGQLIPYDDPRLAGITHGYWQISAHSASWRILRETTVITGEYDDEPVVAAALALFAKESCVGVDFLGESSDIRLRFSNQLSIEFFEVSGSETAWAVLSPDFTASVGPGRSWTSGELPQPLWTDADERESLHTRACHSDGKPSCRSTPQPGRAVNAPTSSSFAADLTFGTTEFVAIN